MAYEFTQEDLVALESIHNYLNEFRFQVTKAKNPSVNQKVMKSQKFYIDFLRKKIDNEINVCLQDLGYTDEEIFRYKMSRKILKRWE